MRVAHQIGLAVAGLLATVYGGTQPSSPPQTSIDLNVGTFNITGVSADSGAHGEKQVWKVRRTAVFNTILGADLDVFGVQEANRASVYKTHLVDGPNQFEDLVNGVNKAAGVYRYELVDQNPNSDALDNRILYNKAKLVVVSFGSLRYPHQTAGRYPRAMSWAVFKAKATGHRFLFTTTHLDPYSSSNRMRQWGDMINRIQQLRGDLPVFVTGDFNSTKFKSFAQARLQQMTDIGIPDALGQKYKTNGNQLRADRGINQWINSFNGYRRDVAKYSYPNNRRNLGNGIDWIFASKALDVKEFEVTVSMDSHLRLTGTIPSDHNMIRAKITLP